eukprot:10798961-Alexandrium_andersonii.AAC.1
MKRCKEAHIHNAGTNRSMDPHRHQASPFRVGHRRLRVSLKGGSECLPREPPQDAGSIITE